MEIGKTAQNRKNMLTKSGFTLYKDKGHSVLCEF